MHINVQFYDKKVQLIFSNSDVTKASVAEWYVYCVLEAMQYNKEGHFDHFELSRKTFFDNAYLHPELKHIFEREKQTVNILINHLNGYDKLEELHYNLTGLVAFEIPGIEHTILKMKAKVFVRHKEEPVYGGTEIEHPKFRLARGGIYRNTDTDNEDYLDGHLETSNIKIDTDNKTNADTKMATDTKMTAAIKATAPKMAAATQTAANTQTVVVTPNAPETQKPVFVLPAFANTILTAGTNPIPLTFSGFSNTASASSAPAFSFASVSNK